MFALWCSQVTVVAAAAVEAVVAALRSAWRALLLPVVTVPNASAARHAERIWAGAFLPPAYHLLLSAEVVSCVDERSRTAGVKLTTECACVRAHAFMIVRVCSRMPVRVCVRASQCVQWICSGRTLSLIRTDFPRAFAHIDRFIADSLVWSTSQP
jgi:hypothetical protein